MLVLPESGPDKSKVPLHHINSLYLLSELADLGGGIEYAHLKYFLSEFQSRCTTEIRMCLSASEV
jgi:hypothetical protein